jgi:hypothetical protein
LTRNKAILAPWYFKKDFPQILKSEVKLFWKSIGGYENCEIYGLGLFDNKNACYGLIKQGTYLLSSNDSKQFIIWSRKLQNNILSLSVYISEQLKTITIDKETRKLINRKTTSYWFNALPVRTIEIIINPLKPEGDYFFHQSFKDFGEILLLTEVEGLYLDLPKDNYWHNTALIKLNTTQDKFYIYPQDHFNKSNADFGYIWMTQVERDNNNGLIKVNGIRMDDFYLDKNYRNRKY